MKRLLYSIRYLLKNKGNNAIKVVSLTLGLVVALVLFSQVAFDLSYDNFYPDKERIYSITCKWNINGKEDADEGRIINAPFAPTMNQEIPEVEVGTVMTGWISDAEYLDGDRKISGRQMIADSLFFQTFGCEILSGSPEDMGKPYHAFVSETFANRAFGAADPLGQRLATKESTYTVAGVFRDIPKNSHLQMDVVVAFNTLYEWGARPGWQNNDAYLGYVKLVEGADPRAVEAKIPDMMHRHYDVEAEIQEGIVREYFLRPMTEIHTKDPEVRRANLILSLLAFALLFASAMNYVLLSVSGLPKRAKAIGVYKCNGASDRNVFRMFMDETLLLIGVSLLAALLIILAFRGHIETLIKSDLTAVFAPANLWVSILVLILLFLTTGVLPARIFSTIPVTQVFRSYADSKKKWKSGLLFVQFVGISFMISLLVIIMMQYHMILNRDMGYDTVQIVKSASLGQMNTEQLETAKKELLRLPQVESITLTTNTPLDGLNGSPVADPETKENLFGGRFLLADADFAQTFNISLTAGRTFQNVTENTNEVIVNETLIRRMGLNDPIGKRISYFNKIWTICGVMKDYQSGSVYNEVFPVVVLPLKSINWQPNIIVRLTEAPTQEVLELLSAQLRRYTNEEESMFLSFKEEYNNYYRDARLFRDSVMVASLIMLVVSLLGLFGFVEDEISRRTKEIAVRKVNGALAFDILRLLAKGITYVATPAIVFGVVISFVVGSEWLQQFALKIPLHVTLFFLCGVAIFAVTQFCVAARSMPVAMSNPVDYLKME